MPLDLSSARAAWRNGCRRPGAIRSTALVGKLAPYFAIFIVMMAWALGIIHGLYEIPFRGHPVIVGAAACLLIIAYLVAGRLPSARCQEPCLRLEPDRHHLLARLRLRGRGLSRPGDERLRPRVGHAAAAALVHPDPVRSGGARRASPRLGRALHDARCLGDLVLRPRLAAAAGRRARRDGPRRPVLACRCPSTEDRPDRIDIVGAFTAEYGRVLRDRGAFALIVMAPIIYGVFYPQPYLGQLVRDVPIAVVDDDGSELSRTIIQALDADEAIKVAARPTTLAEAQAALARREVFGILSIPAGTEREVLKGSKARLPAYVEFRLFPALQPDTPGDTGSDRSGDGGPGRTRRPPRRQPLPRRAGKKLAGRDPEPASVQSYWRLRQLHRPGGLPSHPAADAVDGLGDARRRGIRAGRPRRPPAQGRGGGGHRPRPRPSSAGASGICALPRCSAANLRLLREQSGARPPGAGRTLHSLGQLPRPVRRQLVQAPGNGGAAPYRDQPAALLPRRRGLAGGGHSAAAQDRQRDLSRARPGSTASCGSIKWVRRWPTSRRTGRGCGC